ncbi:uncharacterized protein [Physcomitrium patens]|uniref:uncharacterized protein isoform X3 n=1 Tax=Physcomitrium patens TaxID=3218 RepID=UPI003CCDC595
MEQNPSRIRKAGEKTTTVTRGWRTLHLPLGKKFLSISSNNVDLSLPPEAMMSTRGNDDPLMVIVSSTGYSTDSFEHDEEQIIMDSKKPKTPRKNMTRKAAAQENSSTSAEGVSFVFQKHHSKIDWRILNTIDVDRIIRDVDTDTLEKVMDTIAFGDIHGEDARNITEGNFTKIFRLAQLMVEYLLHALQLLADQKSELLQTGAIMQQKSEKIRQRFLCQRNVLLQTRHELKQAKEVRHCPFCEKVFESSHYLDLHIARRHPKPHDVIEDRIIAIVSKPEDATAARTKAETNIAVQREIQQLRERYQADLQRAETSSTSKVRSLQAEFRQSNNQLHEVQTQLDVLQAQILHSPNNARLESVHAIEEPEDIDNGSDQERLYNLKSKSMSLEQQVNTLGQEKLRLLQKLNVACAEASELQSAQWRSVNTLETQVEDLLKENQYLKKTMSKAEEECTVLSVLKQKQIAPSPRERWTREPEKDQALLALARPASRRRTEVIPAHNDGDDEELNERKSSPEPQPCRHSTSPAKRTQRVVPQKMKYETSPDRSKKLSLDRLRTSVVIKKGKPRGNESPTTVEEMRARLEKEMVSAHEEQQRRQKAVQRLLAKEMAKERVDEKKNQQRKKGEDARSCNSTTQYPNSRKSEFPCESIAPLLLALRKKEGVTSMKPAIHSAKKVVGNKIETWPLQDDSSPFRPKPDYLRFTRNQSLDPPPSHLSSQGCEKSQTLVHHYLGPGLGNPQTEQGNEREKRITSHEEDKDHKIQVITEVAAMDVGEDAPITPTIQQQKWLSNHPFVPITSLPHVVAKYPHPDTAFEKAHEKIANEFDGHFCKELKRYGITSNTNGIRFHVKRNVCSDSTYKSIFGALEKQRTMRMSQIDESSL